MQGSKKVDLKLDWATHKAAEYACKHWHYSKCTPAGKMVKIGVWENGDFIGVLIYSRGASPFLFDKYDLKQNDGCELTRVALRSHDITVSRILSISFKLLKKSNHDLRLVVSFADPNEGHLGIIYQATNWIYTGMSPSTKMWKLENSRKLYHHRSIGAKFGTTIPSKIKGCKIIIAPGKHRYLMPLTKEMRKKILPLSKPYPKKADEAGDGPDQGNSGSATLTRPLQ